MIQVGRAAYGAALEVARQEAYRPGEYVGQESFMTASEIRAVAERAAIGRADSVLDLCCGVAGPGRLLAAETGCRYLGVDADPEAIEVARLSAGELSCRFDLVQVPPLPAGTFDVVLLLETLLAFREKQPLLAEVARALRPGGRFALTVEEGAPLTDEERVAMPGSDTVWPIPLPELLTLLDRGGFTLGAVEELTDAHRVTALALADAFEAHRPEIGARLGPRVVDDLVTAHRLWGHWLGSGRIRKFALVAVR